jgi:hypothetical protein
MSQSESSGSDKHAEQIIFTERQAAWVRSAIAQALTDAANYVEENWQHGKDNVVSGLRFKRDKCAEGASSSAEREPDGYAVLIDDKASSPKGYWFAYAYIDRGTAEKSAAVTKGRVEPIYFASSSERSTVAGNHAPAFQTFDEAHRLDAPVSHASGSFDELAEAVREYDEAIRSCANDPEKMASFCTAQGDDLDMLYFRMVNIVKRAKPPIAASAKLTNEWIEWDGARGVPPVAPDARVDVRFRNGDTVEGRRVDNWLWKWQTPPGQYDIAAYKLCRDDGTEKR